MSSFGQLFVSIGANIEGLSKGFDETEKSIKGFGRRLDGLGRNFQDLGARLTLGITAPLVAVGGVAIKVAGDFEQTEVAFTNLLGSAEKAGDFLRDLEEFAARTPFEFPELTDAAKRLLAFGFEAEQIIPTMTAIGDAAAGLGGGSEAIDRISRALGQIQAKGKASTEELLQLSEVGIGSFKILQEQLGLTGAELEKALRTGAIDAQTAISALLTGIGDQFAGQMEQQSKTFLGQISTLKDEFGFVVRDLGTALLPFAKDALEIIKPVVAGIAEIVSAFAEAPAPIRTAGVALAGLGAVVGPALLAIGTLASSVAGLIPLFTAGGPLAGALAGFGGVLAAITGPVGIAVAVIAGLGVAVYAFRDDIANSRIGEIWSETWENVSASLSAAFDGLSTALSNFTAAFVQRWEEGLFGLRPVIEGVWNGIGAIFVGALETISAIVSGGLEVVTGTINVFAQLLAGNFEGAWEAAKGVFRSALGTLVEIVGAQVGAILGIIDGFASALGKNLKLQEVFDREVEGVMKALDRQSTAVKGAVKPVDDLTKSAKDYGKEAGKIEKPTKDAATAFKGLGAEAKAVKEKLDDLPPPMRFVLRTQEDLEDQSRRIKDEWVRMRQDAIEPLIRTLPTFEGSLDDVAAAANRQITEFNNLTGALVSHQLVMSDSELASLNLGNAYEALGIKSQSVADTELKVLHDALEEIRKQAAEGNPDALAKLSEAERVYADRVKGSGGPIEATGLFKGALQSVSTAITDLGKDVAERFAEKIKTGIGIIDDFSEALIRLASEQVLGLVLSKVGDLLGAIPGLRQLSDLLFGGAASGAAGAAGGAAGSAGQAAGGAAQTGGQVIGGTLGGIVSLASAVTSAITGIVSIFQNARQETTLNAIEENTRRGTLFLGDRGDQGILGTQFRIAENSDYITGNTDEMKVSLWDIRDILRSGITVVGMAAVMAGTAATAEYTGETATNTASVATNTEATAFELPEKFEEVGAKLGLIWQETSAQQTEETKQQLGLLAERIGQSISQSIPGPVIGRTRTDTGINDVETPTGIRGRTRIGSGTIDQEVPIDPNLEELRRRNPLAFGSDNPLASILLGGRDPQSFGADIGAGIDLSGLQAEFEAAQQTANNQLDALHEQTAQLEAIHDAIEAQGALTVNVNIQNAYASNAQEFARTVSREIERQLRNTTRGIR